MTRRIRLPELSGSGDGRPDHTATQPMKGQKRGQDYEKYYSKRSVSSTLFTTVDTYAILEKRKVIFCKKSESLKVSIYFTCAVQWYAAKITAYEIKTFFSTPEKYFVV